MMLVLPVLNPSGASEIIIRERLCRVTHRRSALRIFQRILFVTIFLFFAGIRGLAVSLAPEEQAVAGRLVRESGQQRNRSEMVLDPVLTAVARARAADMAKRGYFSHVNPDGNGPNHLMQLAGYPLPASWLGSRSANNGESIGAGYATAEAAWQGWMNSPVHRTHLLAKQSFYRNQTSFGVGHYHDPGSPMRHYWVVITAPAARGRVVSVDVAGRSDAVRIGVRVPVQDIDGAAVLRARVVAEISPTRAPRPTQSGSSELALRSK